MGQIADRMRAQAAQLLADAPAVAALEDAPAPVPAPAPPAPAPSPVPTWPASDYRAGAASLFQPVAARVLLPRLPGQSALLLDKEGPTSLAVCEGSGWKWENAGGDWIDALGVPQGTEPWSSTVLDAVDVGQEADYTIDVTALLAESITRGIPCAIKVACKAPRTVYTRFGSVPPDVLVTLDDGTDVAMPVIFAGPASQSAPGQGLETMALPAFYEIAKPTRPFTRAVLRLRALTKARNADPTATTWLLAPGATLPPVESVTPGTPIVEHLYADDAPEGDYLHSDDLKPWESNLGAEANWDAALWGGQQDTTKFPHRGQGKWHGNFQNVRVVRSAELPLAPVAPGLGALAVTIPRDPQAVEGGYAPQAGLLACRLDMPLPFDLCGRADRIFTRQYFAWDAPDGDSLSLDDIVAVYRGANSTAPAWGNFGGKAGIVPTHDCTSGGFSGSSGGGGGWQMRWSVGFPATGMPGPMDGTIHAAWHLYDFQHRNPPGYGAAGVHGHQGWGKVGGSLRPRRWYCIETELKLNGVDKPGILADGTPHVIGGVQQFWTPDGALRVWVDGMLAREDTGLVMRSLPTIKRPATANPQSVLYPIRDLGVRSMMLNVYIGGTTPSCKPWTQYYAAFAYGTERIGGLL